jgi:hypothetical protein
MLGNPRSTLIGYTDPELQNRRDEHLRSNETERDRGMK